VSLDAGILTRLKPPRHRRVGNAASALKVTPTAKAITHGHGISMTRRCSTGHRSASTAASHDWQFAPSLAGGRTARDAAGTGGSGCSGGACDAAAGDGS
jgi:hypothetical protein